MKTEHIEEDALLELARVLGHEPLKAVEHLGRCSRCGEGLRAVARLCELLAEEEEVPPEALGAIERNLPVAAPRGGAVIRWLLVPALAGASAVGVALLGTMGTSVTPTPGSIVPLALAVALGVAVLGDRSPAALPLG